MTRPVFYGGIVVLAAAFTGGFLLGRAGQHMPEPLAEKAMARLRLRVDLLRANLAAPVASAGEAYAKAPKAAARAQALAEAADVSPDVVVGFDLRPAASPGTDSGMVEMEKVVENDSCKPSDFSVSGTVQRLGTTWVMDALLTHSWQDEVVWRYSLRGKVSVYDAGLQPSRVYFAGLTYDTERDIGAVFGRQWDSFTVLGGATQRAVWIGGAVRW